MSAVSISSPVSNTVKTIYRYENRKFYCNTKHRYLNRKELVKLVQTKEQFQVIDYENKTDITKKTLISLLTEMPWTTEEVHEIIVNKKS